MALSLGISAYSTAIFLYKHQLMHNLVKGKKNITHSCMRKCANKMSYVFVCLETFGFNTWTQVGLVSQRHLPDVCKIAQLMQEKG